MSAAAVSFGVRQQVCFGEGVDRCLPRPIHHLYSFKLSSISDAEEVDCRVCRAGFGIVTFTVSIESTGPISLQVDSLSATISSTQLVSVSAMILGLYQVKFLNYSKN